jgi:hypothetical protein
MKPKALRTLVLIWVAWFVILYAFQWLVTSRLEIGRPDVAVPWTGTETGLESNRGKIYLLEPFMNRQVAWDSEYYVGIAVGGYADPAAGTAIPSDGKPHIKNYSFFPLYPYAMKVFMLPLQAAGLNPIASASLAGVIVSLLSTLAGMIALYDLTQETLEDHGALRSVFYMLIFPTGFFLAQVYTEGLFIGLAFWSLALTRRKQWVGASLLAVLAAWTRAQGAILALPLGIAWLRSMGRDQQNLPAWKNWRWYLQGLFALFPVAAFLAWRYSTLGEGWAVLQPGYFGRGFLVLAQTIGAWQWSFFDYTPHVIQSQAYYLIEIGILLLALISSIAIWRKYPEVAAFSLAVVILSLLSGAAQSLARYMITVPAMYIVLAKLGRNKAFDYGWTILSLLLLGVEVMLFSFDMWVG